MGAGAQRVFGRSSRRREDGVMARCQTALPLLVETDEQERKGHTMTGSGRKGNRVADVGKKDAQRLRKE